MLLWFEIDTKPLALVVGFIEELGGLEVEGKVVTAHPIGEDGTHLQARGACPSVRTVGCEG